MEKLWTTAEAAQCLSLDEAGIEAILRQGKLTGYRLGGKFLRFRPDQVQALKGQCRSLPAAKEPAAPRRHSWFHLAQDFLYFNDFYIASAACLAILVVYLIAST